MELQLTTCTGQARRYRKGGAKQSWAIVIGRGLARKVWLAVGLSGRGSGWFPSRQVLREISTQERVE